MPTQISSLGQKLTKLHPEHQAMLATLDYWEQASTGDISYSDGTNLIPHPREEPKLYAYRQRLAVYENWAADILEQWISKMYGPGLYLSLMDPDKDIPERDKKILQTYESDFDLQRNTLRDFFRQASEISGRLGTCGLFPQVHNEIGPKPTLVQAEKGTNQLRPFGTIISPKDIRNWEWDRYGKLDWLLIAEESSKYRKLEDLAVSDPSESMFHGSSWNRDLWTRFFLIDKQYIQVFEPTGLGDWTEGPKVEHKITGQVPVDFLYWEAPGKRRLLGKSPLESVYHIQDLIYNLRSGRTEITTNQTYSILVVPKTPGAANKKKGESASEHIIATTRGLSSPAGAGFAPHFISPEADLVRVHSEVINSYEQAIRRIGKAGPQSLVDDGRVRDASGRSKAFDSDQLTAFLRRVGDTKEPTLKHFLTNYVKRSIVSKNDDGDVFKGIVRFPDSFLLRGIREEVDDAIAIVDSLRASETAVKVTLRNLANVVLRSGTTQEELDKIVDELNAAELEDLIPIALQAPVEETDPNMGLGNKPDQPTGPMEKQIDAQRGKSTGERPDQEQPGRSLRRV